MKTSVTLPSSANKYFRSLRDEKYELICTYTDSFVRNFVRKNVKGGRCNAFNQHFKSEISDEVFNFFSEEINVNGNICDLLEKHFEFLNKYDKLYEKEIDSEYEDFKEINQKEKNRFFNNKLNKLAVHKVLKNSDLYKFMKDLDATSLYLLLCGMKNLFHLK